MATTRSKEKSNELDNDELLALARLDISKGNTENALIKIKAVLNDGKTPDEAYSMAAKIYAGLGLYQRAQTMFKTYLEKNPGALLETFQLGMTFFDDGQRQEAVRIWEIILKKQPAHPPAMFYTALATAQEGDTDTARKILDSLIKSAPADNLYFKQGKELLSAIERGEKAKVPAAKDADAGTGGNFLLDAAYGVEH